ncbi:MAG: adenylosuccinate lyase, partial [Bdellovibrionales bacterium]|nr:adenylosuccinate lyase [Bdellovibrionales bacterium]
FCEDFRRKIMIDRYSRPEMAELFSERKRWWYCLRVELAACQEMVQRKWIPKADSKKLLLALSKMEKAGGPDPRQIRAVEARVQHDVIAFVSVVASKIGNSGRWVHFGLTSSDVLDTAMALQFRDSGEKILAQIDQLLIALKSRALENADLACVGRTHGMHAEATVFGLKFLSFFEEMRRNRARLARAFEQLSFGKLSGAVGVHGHLDPDFEASVLSRLGLEPEVVSTQIIPRDRHAELYSSLALLGGSIERMATEIRNLQRSEVGELREGFSRAQKGSSAMPHKRNPISSENLCGCARLLRGYAVAGLESVALWHERDISHSSVERVALTDALILAHYALTRVTGLVLGLEVDRARVALNLESAGPKIFSGAVLLELVRRGASRDLAYQWVQRCAMAAGRDGSSFLEHLETDQHVLRYMKPSEIRRLLSLAHALRNSRRSYERSGLKVAKKRLF